MSCNIYAEVWNCFEFVLILDFMLLYSAGGCVSGRGQLHINAHILKLGLYLIQMQGHYIVKYSEQL